MLDSLKRFSVRASLMACLVVALCVSAFASEGGGSSSTVDISGVTNALTDGLSDVIPTILTAVGVIAAAGLGIFAAKFAVGVGLQMFKKVTGRQ